MKERKKLREREDRKQELLRQGLSNEQIVRVEAEEAYNALPIDKKLRRLEFVIEQAVRQVGNDIQNLRHNDSVLADAMDINFRAVARGLMAAGVTLEKQKEIIEFIEAEIAAEHTTRAQQATASKEAAQAASAEAELKASEASPSVEEAVGVEVPEGATTFGD